ncbi:hypothetical protein TD95_002786 [Thielaviopsis punctulata]|uniref:Peptidase S54 rhomboid domain-containing protein n=1 Tax=Thielaviopsis punctulata TaxID=72032 RepID=A0A0F4ZFV9_9PEZI|nr:hypothetical protein TD95_002786 [Thielaviopsis punctulata]
MSFTNTPVTKFMVIGLVTSSIAASLFDAKHYFYILVDPHLWRYQVLFACMTLYNMRIVERIWGPRKYASFVLVTSMFTAVVPPFFLAFFLKTVTGGAFNYLPAGPTPIIFAILAQYHLLVPHLYQYRVTALQNEVVATSTAPAPTTGLTLSDKSYRYALAIQLAMMQMPGSLLGAVMGWIIGYAWKDFMPSAFVKWRLPGWMVGLSSQKRGAEFEGLRRRLEGEDSATATATASGAQPQDGDAGQRRTMRQQIMDNMGVNI